MITEEEAIDIYSFNNKFRVLVDCGIRKRRMYREAMEVLEYIPWSYFRPCKDETRYGNDPETTCFGETMSNLQRNV